MFRCMALMILAGLIVAAPIGCASDGSGKGSGGAALDAPSLLKGEWVLDSLRGGGLSGTAKERRPTLEVAEDGGASGFAGVNRWMSSLDMGALRTGKFSMRQAATTMMAGEPEAMDLEQRFIGALQEVTAFDPAKLAEGVLSLLGSDGSELLRFVRAS